MTKQAKLPPGLRRLPSGLVRWEKMVDGRRFSGSAPTVKEALAQQAMMIADATRGGVVDPSTVTLGEYLSGWLQGKEKTRAQRTNEIQRAHLRLHIVPQIGKRPLQKLSPTDMRGLFHALNNKGLGASSQRQVHQFLISALGEAQRLELVTRNVAQIVKPDPPRGGDEERLKAFTPAEAAKFVEQAKQDQRSGPLFIFALSTGMRRGELCGLRWSDVDLDGAKLSVEEIVATAEKGVITTTPKTRGSRRTVYLAPSAVQLLREVQVWQAAVAGFLNQPVPGHAPSYKRKRPWADSGRVFVNEFGGTLDPHNLKRVMDRLCKAAGVRQVSIHGLRHTYASLSLMHGVPAEVVSKQLGHSSVAFTLSQYRWVYREERERWALGIDDLLPGEK